MAPEDIDSSAQFGQSSVKKKKTQHFYIFSSKYSDKILDIQNNSKTKTKKALIFRSKIISLNLEIFQTIFAPIR